jgi:hypothetical protein
VSYLLLDAYSLFCNDLSITMSRTIEQSRYEHGFEDKKQVLTDSITTNTTIHSHTTHTTHCTTLHTVHTTHCTLSWYVHTRIITSHRTHCQQQDAVWLLIENIICLPSPPHHPSSINRLHTHTHTHTTRSRTHHVGMDRILLLSM